MLLLFLAGAVSKHRSGRGPPLAEGQPACFGARRPTLRGDSGGRDGSARWYEMTVPGS